MANDDVNIAEETDNNITARPPVKADNIDKKDYKDAAKTGHAKDYNDVDVISMAKADANNAKLDAALADKDEYQRLFLTAGPGDKQGRLADTHNQRPSDNDARNAEIEA